MTAVADLLALARRAVTDEDARPVLEDAIRESGWWDDRIRFDLSNGDDREDCLALLTWPGEMGARSAQVIAEALSVPRHGGDEER